MLTDNTHKTEISLSSILDKETAKSDQFQRNKKFRQSRKPDLCYRLASSSSYSLQPTLTESSTCVSIGMLSLYPSARLHSVHQLRKGLTRFAFFEQIFSYQQQFKRTEGRNSSTSDMAVHQRPTYVPYTYQQLSDGIIMAKHVPFTKSVTRYIQREKYAFVCSLCFHTTAHILIKFGAMVHLPGGGFRHFKACRG